MHILSMLPNFVTSNNLVPHCTFQLVGSIDTVKHPFYPHYAAYPPT